MKIYISGKMRGLPEEESRKKFEAARQYLIELGHDVVNPWDSEKEKEEQCLEWEDYILYDLRIIKHCDALFMLDNWQDSDGAKCEHAFACGRGMEIIYETSKQQIAIREHTDGEYALVMNKSYLHSLLRMIGSACLSERRDWNNIKEQIKTILSEHK